MRSLRTAPLLLLLALAGALTACSDRSDDPPPSSAVSATPTADRSPSGAAPGVSPSAPGAYPAPVLEKTLGTRTSEDFRISDPTFEPLPGARALYGTLGDAAYRIEVPGDWNGGLVLYAHGVRLTSNELTVTDPVGPLREEFIEEGFAWAASSYSENFYVPGIGADDTVALLRHFEDLVGAPDRVYLAGESMGGNVIALLLEHYPSEFDGALAVCGAIGGQEQIDYLLSWVAAAEFTSGVHLPIDEPAGDMSGTANALLRELGPPEDPTRQGRQFESIMRELTGGPRPFFAEGFAEHFLLNFALLQLDTERTSLPVAAATNMDTTYEIAEGLGLSADEVNTRIRRFDPVAGARDASAHPDAVPTTGDIDTPFLTLHNTGDLFVPISHQLSYRAKVEALGKGDLLVQRAIRAPGHCEFSDEEYLAAWEDLVAWVEDGEKPEGDDFTGSLEDAGRGFTTPARSGDPGTP